MKDKLSRKLNIERFDNLSLNKAMETDELVELNYEMTIVDRPDIIEESNKHLADIRKEIDSNMDLDTEHVRNNTIKNEYIIQEMIRELYSLSMETKDPKYFGMMKGFLEVSLKNDDVLLGISNKSSGSKVSGNEVVNIQNNYGSDKNNEETFIRSPSQLLQEYGEAVEIKEGRFGVEEDDEL